VRLLQLVVCKNVTVTDERVCFDTSENPASALERHMICEFTWFWRESAALGIVLSQDLYDRATDGQ
jgi:hypothetical protein